MKVLIFASNIMYVKMHMNVCKHKYMVGLPSRSYTWKRVRFTSCWIQQMNFQGSTVCWCCQKLHYFTLALAFTLQTLNAAFIFKHLHIYSVLNTFYFTVCIFIISFNCCLSYSAPLVALNYFLVSWSRCNSCCLLTIYQNIPQDIALNNFLLYHLFLNYDCNLFQLCWQYLNIQNIMRF